VRSDDTPLLAEVLHDRKLAALKFRSLAPTVLATSRPPADTLKALRAAGYAPVREDSAGRVVVARVERHRAAAGLFARPRSGRAGRPKGNPQGKEYMSGSAAALAARLVASAPGPTRGRIPSRRPGSGRPSRPARPADVPDVLDAPDTPDTADTPDTDTTIAALGALDTEGILAEGILAEGILAEGILAEGILAEGILAEGIFAEGILVGAPGGEEGGGAGGAAQAVPDQHAMAEQVPGLPVAQRHILAAHIGAGAPVLVEYRDGAVARRELVVAPRWQPPMLVGDSPLADTTVAIPLDQIVRVHD
jgi:hypothetical protein